jgi:RNA polymerase sigma-70 factor (ECF subfamily)
MTIFLDRLKAFEECHAYWAGVFVLTFEQFASHLDGLGWIVELPDELASVYLCAACTLRNEAACEILDKLHLRRLRSALLRQVGNQDGVDDLLQQIRERLLVGPTPRIATYRGDGPLQAWLMRIAERLAIDALRRKETRRFLSLDADRVFIEPSSEMLTPDGRRTAPLSLIEHAFCEAISRLPVRDRQLLYLYYVQRLSVEQLGACYGVYRSTIYRRLRRVERRVERDCIRALRNLTQISDEQELSAMLRSSCFDIHVDRKSWGIADDGVEATSVRVVRSRPPARAAAPAEMERKQALRRWCVPARVSRR